MVLPTDFKLHESRFTRETIEGIEFQFDRLDLKSTDIKVFLERFLKISKSATLPPDDPEILHLASKVAYMLSVYDFFDSEEYQKKLPYSDGAKVWFSLAQAAKGEGELALKTLEDVLHITEESGDLLLRIECLGILAQILFVRGSKSKEKLESVLEKIQVFKQKNENLEDFNQMFLSAYLIQSRISSQQLPPDEIVENLTSLNSTAKKVGDSYFTMQLTMDLIMALLSAKEINNAQILLDEVFQTLSKLKYNALKAKSTKILGQLQEAKNDYTSAEKTYLKAKERYLKLDDQIGVAGCVSQLAHLSEKEEQLNKAEQYYNEALALSEKISDYFGMSIALSALARLSAKKSQYSDALKKYKKVLTIAEENKFEHLLPSIYDGLAYVNFIAGDFKSSVKNRELTISFKEQFNYNPNSILLDRMKLGQLHAILGSLEKAFNEFEIALNLCTKLKKKDDIYFDILNWLFEISTALGKLPLAETYIGRADLFASIHNSEEENVQALISRIRFHIQKMELTQAEKLLVTVFEQAQEFPSALTMALALVEKATVLFLKLIESKDQEMLTGILETMDDMLFISLDLEFLPLTMYTKKVLGKVLAYKADFDEGIEELEEAVDLAKELGMKKFEDTLKRELKEITQIKSKFDEMDESTFTKKKKKFLTDGLDFLQQTFWLVSASEHQRV